MNNNDTVQINFVVTSDASTPEKAALEINGLKIALAAIFTRIEPADREIIISNIEDINVENTQNILSILKSVHESAK